MYQGKKSIRTINAQEMVGKTIDKVIVSDNGAKISPQHQIFLQFTDGSYVEMYSSNPIYVTAEKQGIAVEYVKKFNTDSFIVIDQAESA